MNNTITIICKSVIYFSAEDETAFFEWLSKIPSIYELTGKHDELHLCFKSTAISNEDLIELIALFQRYRIKQMDQLAIFLKETNKEWFFDNKKAYWYKKIFQPNRTKNNESKNINP